MTARAHTRPTPAAPSGPGIRLRWWALALPVLTFLALLALLIVGGEAQASSPTPVVPVEELLSRLRQALSA
ncbi:hypothetical protein QNO07_12730 [Streptomyces sp. 549]|uniref:hypothetical protein n=1 Tax=Streptomyces sp. 549 TaxID=3049076 RepID=UPI0024C37D42|nr:hypothetical protein [Streptomyces sp. 549]MDK1474274.1 hypothetical protein [Streptomyces sp. 549]